MKVQQTIYKVEVLEVHSGDDLIIMVNLGLDNLFKKVRARLHGVDTPDAYKAGPETEAGKVRDKVKHLVKNKKCLAEVHSMGSNPKGGWVVTLYLDHDCVSPTLNNILRDEGYVFRN